MKTTIRIQTEAIEKHVAAVSDEARRDMSTGQWDEVMTDALYAACGATEVGEMQDAKNSAEGFAAARDKMKTEITETELENGRRLFDLMQKNLSSVIIATDAELLARPDPFF